MQHSTHPQQPQFTPLQTSAIFAPSSSRGLSKLQGTQNNRFLQRSRAEDVRVKEQTDQIQKVLAVNKLSYEKDKVKEHQKLVKQKRRDDYEYQLSMSDGLSKHPSTGFLKANKVIEEFTKQSFLKRPQIALEIEDKASLQRRIYLRSFVRGEVQESPWNPTKSVPSFFDNNYQLKPVEDFCDASGGIGSQRQKQTFKLKKDSKVFESRRSSMPLNNSQPTINVRESSGSQIHIDQQDKEKKISSQTILERAQMKPNSANNLQLLKQILSSEKNPSLHQTNPPSAGSGMARGRHENQSSNQLLGLVSSSDNHRNASAEWINAYHAKETFSRPLFDNIDIKLQEVNQHLKAFKPNKAQGHEFGKFISLEAAESRSRRPTSSLASLDAIIQKGPYEIPRQRQKRKITHQ